MKNFPIIIDDKKYWISRSVAVAGYIFCTIDGVLHILAGKRGKGAADFQGYWNAPCGYLDFNETTREACTREIAEETNLYVNPLNLNLFNINDSPLVEHQNITFRYWTFSRTLYKGQTIYAKGAEENEVEDVEWIAYKDLDKYDFAFNQKETIKEIVESHLKDYV